MPLIIPLLGESETPKTHIFSSLAAGDIQAALERISSLASGQIASGTGTVGLIDIISEDLDKARS